jgi:hypothetical protein
VGLLTPTAFGVAERFLAQEKRRPQRVGIGARMLRRPHPLRVIRKPPLRNDTR